MFIWFYIIHLLQIDVDIGSSTVANGVLGLVVGVITTLVVDMAFLVQVRFFFTYDIFSTSIWPEETAG